MAERLPAEVFPSGEFIKEELEARSWTQDDLAEIMGRPARLVNEVITGKRGITPETAKGLGDAFGTEAKFWMNLEAIYRLSLTQKTHDNVSQKAKIYSIAPVRNMVKRGWLEYTSNTDVLERQILNFFNINNMNDTPKFWARTRKSTSYEEQTPAQIAWLYRARQLSTAVDTKTFSRASLQACLEQLRSLLYNPQDVRHIPKLLADCGIRFLIVEHLPQTHIDGACFWIGKNKPVIVLSLRYDRIDWFWHTLMHELGHVKQEDGKTNNNIAFDTNLVGEKSMTAESKPEYENKADRFAVEYLIPQDKLDKFILRTRPLYSQKSILGFARNIEVHPGIVVGQLHHRKEFDYSHHRGTLEKVRHIITDSALTDGWGQILPSNL